ncbi:hypothetical protein JL09_g6302 [Pichia kudriavzevii]|uniref:Uncharacterized protein n=1 Tax=Pichia kudriavzevii TaxID=4909 RepID=A0A099NPU0_PICKU|nr:hypothetical protein JL09_g6302 [Pichia kudriavzevii]
MLQAMRFRLTLGLT